MNKKSVAQHYTFLGIMLGAMILGALFGWLAPSAATAIKPLGTVFINMMFCIVVPLVFSSIAGAVANMKSRRRAGKIMGVTVATFVITGAIAAVIMFLLIVLVACRLDAVMGSTFVRDAVVIGFICNETLSIIENAGLMGLPIPAVITKAVDILKQRSEGPEGQKGTEHE